MSEPSLESLAQKYDAEDELAKFREAFYLLPGKFYFDGHSLGLLSTHAEQALLQVLHEWKVSGFDGWTHAESAWLGLGDQLSRLAAPLMGARADEIAFANATTVNLHQLVGSLFQPRPGRSKILVDELSFPSNLYALRSHLRLRGLDPDAHLVVVPSRDGDTVNEADIIAKMSNDIQIAVLPSVVYQSGQLLDISLLTAEAKTRGVLIGFDCSHSAGILPHRFDECGVDFAYWCTYKYLNSGPGSTSGLYLNSRHFGCSPGLAGWFGTRPDRQFDFADQFEPAKDARALQISTPHILSMAPLSGSLGLVNEAGIDRIREKSLKLTRFLIQLIDSMLKDYGVGLATPREDTRRGGHIALVHPEAEHLSAKLRKAGVITDYRPPSIVRFSPSPLYVSFKDCYEAILRLQNILAAPGI